MLELVLTTLPKCKDEDERARQLQQYCEEYRSLYLKLMALVEFAGQRVGTAPGTNSGTTPTAALAREFAAIVQNTSALMQDVQQRKSYIETTTQLLDDIHEKQTSSIVPPYATEQAIEILATGQYNRMPTHPMCQYAELRPIVLGWTPPAKQTILDDLDRRLRHRVSQSNAAEMFTNVVVGGGKVVLYQAHEFRIELTLMHEQWRVLHTDCLVGESRGVASLHAQPSSQDLSTHIKYLLTKVPTQNNYDDLFDNCMYVLNELQRQHSSWNVDITHVYETISNIQLQHKIIVEFSKSATLYDDPLVRLFDAAHNFCYSYALLVLHRQAARDHKMSNIRRDNYSLRVPYWRPSAMHQSCAVVISYANKNNTNDGNTDSSYHQQELCLGHSPPLSDSLRASCTIQTMALNMTQIVENAKRSQASVLLSNAWDSLIETLPWFLTPSDVHLTWHGTTHVTSLVISMNGGSIDFVVQIDMPTGWYRCSMVAKHLPQENHAPLSLLVAACPLRAIEQQMNTFGGAESNTSGDDGGGGGGGGGADEDEDGGRGGG